MSLKTVHLEDNGQDFLYFDYDDEEVLPKMQNVGPFHGNVYNGQYILNAFELKVGVHVKHSKSPQDPVYVLKYPIVMIQ